MRIGYVRISSADQNPDLQLDALSGAHCDQIITDRISGTVATRPGLDQVRQILRSGDVLVVWRLDRLARSMKDLVEWMAYLEERQVGLESLQEAINTTTTAGKLVFHIMGAIAEFERGLIHERTMAGLRAARARGRKGGRPRKLSKEDRSTLVRLYAEGHMSVKKLTELYGISKPTLYRCIQEHQEAQKEQKG
jgi:DNA invertase Pin-like site-specific DNA recombinase